MFLEWRIIVCNGTNVLRKHILYFRLLFKLRNSDYRLSEGFWNGIKIRSLEIFRIISKNLIYPNIFGNDTII